MDGNGDETLIGVGSTLTGLGVITMALFPLALPGLLLAVLAILPLVLLAIPVAGVWMLASAVGRLRRRKPVPELRPRDAKAHASLQTH